MYQNIILKDIITFIFNIEDINLLNSEFFLF